MTRKLVIRQLPTTIVTLIILISTTVYITNNNKQITTETVVIPERIPVIMWYTDKDIYNNFDNDGKVWWLPDRPKINCTKEEKVLQCNVVTTDYKGDANAYIFYGNLINDFPQPRNGKIWGLVHEETPKNMDILMHEEALNLFNYSATFSRFSDVPMPLYYMQELKNLTSLEYYIRTQTKNAFLSEISPVLYLQSDCQTSTERDEYVSKLMEYIPVDSYGNCLRNKRFPAYLKHLEDLDFPSHLYDDVSLQFIAKYKFVIAIENAVCKDYVTEKLWRAIHVGTVPIYYGSPVIRDWLPNNKSAILIEDFPTPELMSKHLHELLDNDTMYEEYLEHKTKGIISNRRIYEELEARPYQTNLMTALKKLYCVMCERLHENSSRDNVVTKKHYDCPVPTSPLTLSVNPNNPWLRRIHKAKKALEYILNNMK